MTVKCSARAVGLRPASPPPQFDFDREYSAVAQLCYEVRVLLALAHLDELAGPDQTHMRYYQRDKVQVLLERVEACQCR